MPETEGTLSGLLPREIMMLMGIAFDLIAYYLQIAHFIGIGSVDLMPITPSGLPRRLNSTFV